MAVAMAVAKQERRIERVQVMVTSTERQRLERAAQRSQLSLSEAARQAILRDLNRGPGNIIDRGPGA